MAALAVLTICAADAASEPDEPVKQPMIALTVNEIRRLINMLVIQPIRDLAHRLRWSAWRRQHQARARQAHYARRLSLKLQP